MAERDGVVAFVEVKARGPGAWSHPLSAITPAKRRALGTAARGWIAARGRPYGNHAFRFDAVAVRRERGRTTVDHIEDAWRP